MRSDSLGDRIKSKYEDPFRITLPQRTNVILRIDGKAFHTFTKKMPRPYHAPLADAMDVAAAALCKNIMGAKFAYGQSDEYSFLLTDYDELETEMWFKGNVQKMASVAASMFTAHFNRAWTNSYGFVGIPDLAMFDARVFIIPSRSEVQNYFIWRQQDATRNSLSMLARAHFSHKDLHGKNSPAMHDLLHNKGINWNNMPTAFRRGRVIRKEVNERSVTYTHRVTKEVITKPINETSWVTDLEIPVFTQDPNYLGSLIPYPEERTKTV